MVINDIFERDYLAELNGRKELLSQIQVENNRLTKARKLLLDDAIDSSNYKAIKLECETHLNILEGKLTGYFKPTYDLEVCVSKALEVLSSPNITYEEGDIEIKRSIISSIYLEKLYYKNIGYRTVKVNEAAQLVYLINSQLRLKKSDKLSII